MSFQHLSHGTVTPDDHGAILQVVAWVLMVVMILSISLRLTIRFTTTHIPGLDDVMVFGATLSGIGEIVAVSLAVNSGLGKRLANLSQTQISVLEKNQYASTILYLLTLCLAKISTLILIARLIGLKVRILAVVAIVLLWTIASVSAVAFQCGLPRPWDYVGGECFGSIPFWAVIGAVDILTDTILIVLPVWVVWKLHITHSKKLVVCFAFAFRVVLIAAAVARLVFLKRLSTSTDVTFDTIPSSICTQCQTTFSVVVACIPALKPFMDRADSGMLNVSLRTGPSGVTDRNQSSYFMRPLSKPSGDLSNFSNQSLSYNPKRSQRDNEIEHFVPTQVHGQKSFRPDLAYQQSVMTGCRSEDPIKVGRDNTGSGGNAASDKMVIQQTKDWWIQYEDDHQALHNGSSVPSHDSLSRDNIQTQGAV